MVKQRVLIVEDEVGLLDKYALNIAEAGFEVTKATSKEEAVQVIADKHFHVAVIDVMLVSQDQYDRSGYEVVKAIREQNEGTRCIAISGFPSYEAPAEAVRLGLDDYIPKPTIYEPADYVLRVQQQARACKPNLYGKFDALLPYLAGEEDFRVWEAQIVEVLQTDAKTVHQAASALFDPYLPVLLRKNVADRVRKMRASGRSSVVFDVWSRGTSQQVVLSIATSPDATSVGSTLRQRTVGGLYISSYTNSSLSRSDYVLGTYDIEKRPSSHS